MIAPQKIRLAALAAAAALSLTACSGSGEADPNAPLTLEFPSWQAEDPAFGAWWKELIAAYEDEHPDVKIDYYPIPFDSYVDQLTTRFAANDQPEIVQLPARNATEFASRGWLEPLGERLATTDILETWTPLQEEMNWEGKSYGVLLLGYGYSLYYNESLLEEADVSVPTNADELVAAAEAVTGNGNYGFGATTQQSPDNYTELMAFVTGNGDALSNDEGEFFADSPEFISAMEQYRAALEQAPSGIQTQQRNELFLNGNIAMLLDGPFFVSELDNATEDVKEDLKVAAAPFDVIPGGVSNSIHVPAGLDDRTEDAVWEFIELASSAEWQARYAEVAAVPAPRSGVITDEALDARPELELFQDLADQAKSIFPSAPDQREQFSRLSQIVSQAAVKLMSTDDTTKSIAEELQTELEKTFGEGQ